MNPDAEILIESQLSSKKTTFSGVHNFFEKQACETPDAIALRQGESFVTYNELNKLANGVAYFLREKGIKHNNRIIIFLPRSINLVIAILGVLKAGAAYVPVDYDYPIQRIKHIFNDSESDFIITNSLENLDETEIGDHRENILSIDQILSHTKNYDTQSNPKFNGSMNDLVYIIYTSGSTGNPKGVMVDHGNLINSMMARIEYYSNCKLKFLLLSSVAFDSSVAGIFWPLFVGGELILLENSTKIEPELIIKNIEENHINGFLCVPSLYRVLLPAIKACHNHSLEFVILAGENVTSDLVESHSNHLSNITLYNEYGPTEACIWISVAKLYDGIIKGKGSTITIGKAITNNKIYILDENGFQVDVGEIGEIYIAGSNVARGYYNQPELTDARFVNNHIEPRLSKKMYRSGDLARKLEDGRYEFIGRNDEQIKLRGYRIELGEIENVIRQYSGVFDVIVIAKEQESNIYLVANLIINENYSEEAIRSLISAFLPAYMWPNYYVIWNEFPKSPNGKIDKKSLQQYEIKIHSKTANENYQMNLEELSNQTELEKTVISVWKDVFEVDCLSLNSDFFDLGGDSIKAISFVIKMIEKGFQISAEELVANSTVRSIVNLLETNFENKNADSENVLLPTELLNKSKISPSWSIMNQKSYGLSSLQEGIYLQSLLNQDKQQYFIQDCYFIDERIDPVLLTKTWNDIVNNYDILRTGFITNEDGKAIQFVSQKTELAIDVDNFHELDLQESDSKLSNILKQYKQSKFEFEKPPLAKVHLININNNRSIIILNIHHVLLDGWSMAILIAKLLDHYYQLKNNIHNKITVNCSYESFIAWLSYQEKTKAQEFWYSYLANFYQTGGFCSKILSSPQTSATKPCVYRTEIPEELITKISNLAKLTHVTINNVFQVAWAIIVARYIRQDDVVFGITVSGRHINLSGIDKCLGLFINTVPFRMRVSRNSSVSTLLIDARDALLKLQQYSYLSLAEIQAITKSHRYTDTGLFDHFIAFLNHPNITDFREYEQPKISQVRVGSVNTEYPLSISVFPDDNYLLEFIYQDNLLANGGAQLLANQLMTILTQLSSESTILKLNFMTSEDYKLIHKINDNEKIWPSKMHLFDYIKKHANSNPNAIAIVEENSQFSYLEIEKLSNQFARYLQNLGINKGQTIAVCLERCAWLVVCMLGINKIGAVFVPFDPAHPNERLVYMANDANIKILITSKMIFKEFQVDTNIYYIENEEEKIRKLDSGDVPTSVGFAEPAYVTYTSGSTGYPKGVINTHEGIHNRLIWSTEAYDLGQSIKLLHNSAIGFDIAIWEMYFPLIMGGQLVIVPPDLQKDPVFILNEIQKHEISIIHLVPSLLTIILNKLEQNKEYSVKSVRNVVCGGEVLSVELHNRFHIYFKASLHHTYGPTEAAISVTNWSSKKAFFGNRVPLGLPIVNAKIFICDEDMQLSPVGTPGEIYIGGVPVALGYLNQDQLNEQNFIQDTYFETGGKLYKTGDFGRYLISGEIEYIGRVDEQVKIRGIRLELGEIENNLLRNPAVTQAVSVISEIDNDKCVVAYVVPSQQTIIDIVARYANENIGSWRNLYDDIYSLTKSIKADFDTIGWNSSYTNKPFSQEEMKDWSDATIKSISKLQPKNVLEIGCGTGILLFELAPKCQSYTALDFSQVAVDKLRLQLEGDQQYKNVILFCADAFEGLLNLREYQFDTIIINSVIQYFPSSSHVKQLIERSLELLSDDGKLFIGDVRNYHLLYHQHASVLYHKAESGISVSDLQIRIENSIHSEEELLIAPNFFINLMDELDNVAHVQTLVKIALYDNEMSKFRYDVVIHKSQPFYLSCDYMIDYENNFNNLSEISDYIQTNSGKSILIYNVKNKKLFSENKLVQAIQGNINDAVVSQLELEQINSNGIDPYELSIVLNKLNYNYEMLLDDTIDNGFCVFLWKQTDENNYYVADSINLISADNKKLSNNPLLLKISQVLAPELRSYLQNKIPDYMLPNQIVILESMPLNVNGKIERKKLPRISQNLRRNLNSIQLPINDVEKQIHDIWCRSLNLEAIDINENFFSIGGHSLLATKIIASINSELSVNLSIRDVFKYPTIAGFASMASLKTTTTHDQEFIPKRNCALRIPLSSAQKRLWFLYKLEPEVCMYNMPSRHHIYGNLNTTALHNALESLYTRHSMLRMIFRCESGQLYQEISKNSKISFKHTDISNIEFDKQTAIIKKIEIDFNYYLFDLDKTPAIIINLIKVSEQEHYLLINMHHIISDGWSMDIFFNELEKFYNSADSNATVFLANQNIDYADFAAWHNQVLLPKITAKQIAYWKRKLDGCYDLISMPYDFSRPKSRTHHGAHYRFTIPKTMYVKLRELSDNQQCTLNVTLLTVFKVLLYKYTMCSDVIVGIPLANRHYKDVQEIIGFFVNSAAIRTSIHPNESFIQVMKLVNDNMLEAIDNQDIPFEQIVKSLKISQDTTRHPIFQIMFVLEKANKQNLKLQELNIIQENISYDVAKFDITLRILESNSQLDCELQYATELISSQTAIQLSTHFLNILQEIINNPELKIADIVLFGQDEFNILLQRWSGFKKPVPDFMNWIYLFEAAANKWPDNIALEFYDEKITYCELLQVTNKVAYCIKELGIGRGSIVGICLPRTLELMIITIAVMKAGAAYLPLDEEYPDDRLLFMLNDSKSKYVITHKQLISKFDSTGRIVIDIVNLMSQVSLLKQINFKNEIASDDLAYVIYTSGSTGLPKGVMVEHKGLANLSKEHSENFSITEKSKMLQFSSYSFDASVLEYCTTLVSGGTLVLVKKEDLLGAQLIETMNKYNITIAMPSPSLLAMIPNPIVPSMKTLILGGETASPTVIKYWLNQRIEVINSYGPTETTVCACFFKYCNDQISSWNTIGKPLANVELYILDEFLRPVPFGVPGQLFIGGIGVTRGYLDRPELTKNVFIDWHPRNNEIRKVYASGDLVKCLPSGDIEYLGRIDNQVKIRGYRIELGEIESRICTQPYVKDAVVVVKEDSSKYLVAYLVFENLAADLYQEESQKIAINIKKWLPTFMVPRYFVPIDIFPLTLNGKIDRKMLANKPILFNDSTNQVVKAKNSIEKKLVEIFSNILEIPIINVYSDFFDVGGHSLLAITLIEQINSSFNVNLPVSFVFRYRTIIEMASQIANVLKETNVKTNAITHLNKSKEGIPLFLVHPIQGTASCYFSFAQSFETAIWGIDNPYLGKNKFSSIEEMAQFYVNEIIQICPTGKINLAGWSFGGAVAIAMAVLLEQYDFEVVNIILIDSYNFTHLNKEVKITDEEILASILKNIQLESNNTAIINEIKHNTQLAFKFNPPYLFLSNIFLLKANSELSNDKNQYHLEDNGWSNVFPKLTKYHLSGTHFRLFEDNTEEITNIFKEILD